MTDIVNQLRTLAEYSNDVVTTNPTLLVEAADEIERLRKENELLRLGWFEESKKRMTEWKITSVSTTKCSNCNGSGYCAVHVFYRDQYGNPIFYTNMCPKCIGTGLKDITTGGVDGDTHIKS